MSERAPFLNAAYSAYHHRGMPADDEEMTRVGPDTPGGEYLRRFWQPIILASELGDLPRRLRILGEDLVAFRDKSGAIGVMELHCPHRGTSLEYGLIDATRASAAAITAGCSTWTARSSRRRASRPTAR